MVILAVDDEKIALDNLIQSIRKCVPDADIHGFRKARDAQAFIETNHCDIAFLDINLRGASGIMSWMSCAFRCPILPGSVCA